MNSEVPLEVRVWGEFACFTRPEMKVERVTYPVMTPSAARGVLEAIFWKPQFVWRIEEIWVLKDIQYFSLVRNEVKNKANITSAFKWNRQQGSGGFYADESRTQRHTLALRDVDYVIRAQIKVKDGVEDKPAKFRDQFRRRVRSGRCFATPYLGCREFAAYFAPPDGAQPINRTDDLGRMLLDIDYVRDGSGRGQPRFFAARLVRGILKIP